MGVVVVTGGTRGVGAGIARAFLRDGAEVVVCGRNAPERPPAAAGREASYLPLDVRDPAAAEEFVHRVARDRGSVDVLVNNAGGTPYRPLSEGGPGRHARVLELNLLAPLHLSRAVQPVMRQQPGGGVILMIGSMSGTRPSPGTAAYGAAKAGLASLAGSMAVEWAPDGIRVNTLVLGMVATERLRDHFGGGENLGPALGRTIPLGRPAEPGEVGEACVFLASPGAAYITGASLAVHGGGERLALHEVSDQNQDP